MKKLTSLFENPIDDVPVSSMPSKELVPFDEEYVIPSGSDEDIPSALEVKKTKATEHAALKKRKASAALESLAPKKAKILTSSLENPIDVVPLASMPSKELVPHGEEYQIPEESAEEDPSAASTEQMDEEIEVEAFTSTPHVSSPTP